MPSRLPSLSISDLIALDLFHSVLLPLHDVAVASEHIVISNKTEAPELSVERSVILKVFMIGVVSVV